MTTPKKRATTCLRTPVEEAAEPVDEYAAVEDEPEVADDGDDDDIDALFA